ncbi:MAG: hypothetical protein HY302_16695 [Opitutae bacterium]|nr:hypothetical protein [Opitutae bacterium]
MLNLGAAAGYAGLELNGAPVTFTLSKVTARVDGNIGIAANGSFDFSGGGEVTGGIYAGPGATVTISGGSTATDGVFTSYAGINQAVQDAHTAAAYYAGLTPGHTLSSLGAGTLTGNGGLNVFQINGDLALSQYQSLILNGTASDIFVFNITGQVNLSKADIVLCGVSPDAVLFNLIGTGQKVLSTGHSNTQGVFLAENGAIQVDGGVHTSDFIAGDTLIWQSGVNITQATSAAVVAVPEAGTTATLVLTLGGLAALVIRRRRQQRLAVQPSVRLAAVN